jgi:hypothetical protein
VTDALAIPVDELAEAQQTALVRLLLFVTGETHRAVYQVADAVARKAQRLADADGALPDGALFSLEDAADQAWGDAWAPLVRRWEQARRHAAAIPYGVLAAQHDALFAELPAATADAAGPERRAMGQDLDDLLDAAATRAELGNRGWSRRLWALDRATRQGMRDTLLASVAAGRSAYETAQDFERYLGAGAECPRWTRARLRLTKAQIAAGDSTGLRTGSDCDSRGVAYAALRLARTEIQAVHHLAAARAYARSPWVGGVHIRLSTSHPKPDICDAHAGGGPLDGGAYPVGDQPLPPYHPHCLCYQAPMGRPASDVRGEAQQATAGDAPPAAWRDYAAWLGRDAGQLAGLLLPLLGAALMGWLGSDPDEMEELIDADPAA